MADTSITLEDLIGKLGKFQEKTTNQCLDILRDEVPIGLTQNLYRNTKILSMSPGESIIGVDVSEVPYVEYVLNGRGEVYPNKGRSKRNPKHAHTLRWEDYDGQGSSIHHGKPNVVYYRMKAGPAQANNFIERAAQQIRSADLDVGGFKGWARRNVTRPVSQFFKNLWKR